MQEIQSLDRIDFGQFLPWMEITAVNEIQQIDLPPGQRVYIPRKPAVVADSANLYKGLLAKDYAVRNENGIWEGRLYQVYVRAETFAVHQSPQELAVTEQYLKFNDSIRTIDGGRFSPGLHWYGDLTIDGQSRFTTVMQYGGIDLEQILSKPEYFDRYIANHNGVYWGNISHIATKLLDYLELTTRYDCLHRDIKIENVLFNNQKEALIIDPSIQSTINDLRNNGMRFATPYSLPPFQCYGVKDNLHSEVFAVTRLLADIFFGSSGDKIPALPMLYRWYAAELCRIVDDFRKTRPSAQNPVTRTYPLFPSEKVTLQLDHSTNGLLKIYLNGQELSFNLFSDEKIRKSFGIEGEGIANMLFSHDPKNLNLFSVGRRIMRILPPRYDMFPPEQLTHPSLFLMLSPRQQRAVSFFFSKWLGCNNGSPDCVIPGKESWAPYQGTELIDHFRYEFNQLLHQLSA